jgi:hypothetical protein
VNSGYKPNTVYAYVSDYATGTYKDYSSDLYEQQQYGYSKLAFDGVNFSFSFDFGTNTSDYSYIDVYAYDNVNGISHGHTIYVNTGTWTASDYYYKPGRTSMIAPGTYKARREAHERMQHELHILNRR